MRVNEETSTRQQHEGGAQITGGAADNSHAPRKLTFAENAILTVKVLAGAGLVLAAFWGLNLLTSTN